MFSPQKRKEMWKEKGIEPVAVLGHSVGHWAEEGCMRCIFVEPLLFRLGVVHGWGMQKGYFSLLTSNLLSIKEWDTKLCKEMGVGQTPSHH